MQHKLKLLCLIILLSNSWLVNATVANYVGVDYTQRIMKGRDRDAYAMRDALGDNYSGVEVYGAHRFNNDVGLSLGWLESKSITEYHIYAQNELFLGPPQDAGDSTNIKTRIQEAHFDVNGYFDVTNNFELVGQLGLGLIRVNTEGVLVASGVTTNLNPSHNYNVVPRIAFGLQYFLPFNIGLRGLFSWEGTNLYSMKLTDEDGLRLNIRPFRQSWSFAVGLVGRF